MRDDLDAGLAQAAEEVLAPEVDLAADGIDRQPDLDARCGLGGECGQEGLADVAGLVAVDQQVDVVGGGRDVLEHPREVALAVEERLDGRADRRREGLGKVGAADPRAGDELGRADRCVLGADGVRVERIGRDAACAATPERGTRRGDGGSERERPATAHPRGPLPEMAWNVNWPP